uniref:Rad21/Rec8-like protein C-terminal eukaryotic domain-containing protein n=1 Tax=Calcidiscus leptoporus TaxID=127549 RepID=A0A7S0NVP8_9EUKA
MRAQLADTSHIVRTVPEAAPQREQQLQVRGAPVTDPFLAPSNLPLVARDLLESAAGAFGQQPLHKKPRSTCKQGVPVTESAVAQDADCSERAAHEPHLPAMEMPEAFPEPFPEPALDENMRHDGASFDFAGEVEQQPIEAAASKQQQTPQPAPPPPSFDAARELPNVDANAMAESKAVGGSQGDGHDPSSWSARTQKMYSTLNDGFHASDGVGLSYEAMIARTRSKHRRRVVAGCFQELLFLTTHGLTELSQHQPYADIVIHKTDLFDTVSLAA